MNHDQLEAQFDQELCPGGCLILKLKITHHLKTSSSIGSLGLNWRDFHGKELLLFP